MPPLSVLVAHDVSRDGVTTGACVKTIYIGHGMASRLEDAMRFNSCRDFHFVGHT